MFYLAAVSEKKDKLDHEKNIQINTIYLHHLAICFIIYRKWMERKSTMISEEFVFSHLFEALKCNFIYKLSIRFNTKFRLPCLSKTISEMESKDMKL